MAGYIKIYRKLLDWGWFGVPSALSTFIYLLLKANFIDSEYKGVLIKRGQAVFGYEALAEKTGISVKQARSAIDKLKRTGEISVWTNRQFSVATIANYELYQADEGQTEGKRRANEGNNEGQTEGSIIRKKERKKERIYKRGTVFSNVGASFDEDDYERKSMFDD